MRFFTTAIILATLFVIGFTPNPASAGKKAKCAALIEKAEGLESEFSGRKTMSQKIQSKLLDARAAQKNGKHGKCIKILKKFVKNNS